MSDRAKDAEILALRYQITVLKRQLQGTDPGQLARLNIRRSGVSPASSTSTNTPPELRG
jgi:hypothetical protein